MNTSLMKQPSAWMPIVMSLAALGLVLGYVALFGNVRQEDEGTAAHLYQLLMAGQLPIVAWFAVKWLPRDAAAALRVLAIQALAGLAAIAALYFFEHG